MSKFVVLHRLIPYCRYETELIAVNPTAVAAVLGCDQTGGCIVKLLATGQIDGMSRSMECMPGPIEYRVTESLEEVLALLNGNPTDPRD